MNGNNYRHDYDDGGDLPDRDPRETVEGGVGGYSYEFDDGYGGGNGGGYGGGANTSGRSYFSGGMSETSSVTSGWESREDSTRYSESTHGIEGASRTLEEINARLYASRYGGGAAGGVGVGGSSSAGGGGTPRETVEGGVGGYSYEFDDGVYGGGGVGGANTSGRSYFSGSGMSETSSVTSGWESREDSTRYSESTHGIEGASRTLEEINARLYASRYGGGAAGGVGVGGSSSAGGGMNGSQTRFGGGGGGGGRSDIDVISEVLESLNEGGDDGPSAAAQQQQRQQQPQLVSQSSLGDTLSTGREEEDADERDLYAARFGRESGAYPSSYYRGTGGDGDGGSKGEDDIDDGRVPSLSSSLEFEEGPDGAG
eukprot:CAMPEP_0197465032 /NCGR_PEP_ID=MMETSP1175-20131217/64328_1 /TAXON_ID=1003142 /ORGANISM="Triceratium dubium, Strain CCMP147" /LENGTH=369 /DNA_ID=CAMNT_0043001037 /DNA_START=220 /DNA_END=1326 /DNA_ORIENTATION=+